MTLCSRPGPAAEMVGHPQDEVAHPGRHQVIAALGVAETRLIDRDEPRLHGKYRPGGNVGEEAFRPGAEVQRLARQVEVRLALRHANAVAVDLADVRPDRGPYVCRYGAASRRWR